MKIAGLLAIVALLALATVIAADELRYRAFWWRRDHARRDVLAALR